jgi:hypothetical protein
MTMCLEARAQEQAPAERRQASVGVQPTGFLLGLSSDWRVSCASANLYEFIGIEADRILGRQISSFLTGDAVHLIRNRVALLRDEDSPERLVNQQLMPGGKRFDAALRLSSDEIILEAVRGSDSGGIDVAGAVERMLKRLEGQDGVEQLALTATRELRGLTGFDGIQIYRNGEGAPECVASFVRSGLSVFEPTNVRRAALRRPLWVADCASEPVPVLCASGERLKSGPALLAPPDEALREEIQRSGASSAVLLPISGAAEQWGFALALHRSARAPRLARLSAAELFAQILGLRFAAAEPLSD